ncbi:MAG: 16S rRNA (uracil(1498)-N(3))-methyltransferase [Candidatus Heteroscillospira sp.]
MPRFFMAGSNMHGSSISITGADAEHIRVLRMRLGDELYICDGEGTDRRCRLTHIGDGCAQAEVKETMPCPAEPSVNVTVLAGLPKGERADYLVQKCTEAGASTIAFFLCERCVVKLDGKNAEKKRLRWQRIAEEAAKQSGRGIIPNVLVLQSLAEALDMAVKTELPLLMYETGERVPLRQALESKADFSTAAILTGPEGGFEKFEVDLAAATGIPACSMGPRILRCETAPVVALTAVMYSTGNL